MGSLPYDPGVIPNKPAPTPGDTIKIEVKGLPPYKDISRSIRNISHPRYDAFVALRKAATVAMNGRACYTGAVSLDLVIYAPGLHKGQDILDYAAGIEDTIDGSCGRTFTYLPIVMQDDCQVVNLSIQYVIDEEPRYCLLVKFL